jgi:hypothetical protein
MRISLGDFAPAAAMYPIPQNSVTAAVQAGLLPSAPTLGLSVSDVNSGPVAFVNPGAGVSGLGGLGACSQADPYPGTFSSINCPTSCWLLGNGLDMELLGQECWPCGNTCPSGTCWDTTALACSGTPATTNAVVPTNLDSSPVPTPIDCTSVWNQLTNAQCGGSSLPIILGGVAIVAILGIVLVNKL